MDTRGYTNKAPYLTTADIDAEQVTIDAYYYSELKRDATKYKFLIKSLKKYFELIDSPFGLSSDQYQELVKLELILKK
jgi:hypothetical protein